MAPVRESTGGRTRRPDPGPDPDSPARRSGPAPLPAERSRVSAIVPRPYRPIRPLPRAHLAAALVAAALSIVAPPAASARVAAAADLVFALDEIAAGYRTATGRDVAIAYGSSGQFAQQIENGAPFELFLSADESYGERLAARGLTRDRGEIYAVGRLALFVPHGSPLSLDPSLADLRSAAAGGRLVRFAIANPEHAPYGRAARQALVSAGARAAVEPRLVLGESAAQAMRFATAGAQGGLVPWPLAQAPEAARRGRAVLVPAALHAPLRQRMVLTRRAGPDAERFRDWIRTPVARAILVKHGFEAPDGR